MWCTSESASPAATKTTEIPASFFSPRLFFSSPHTNQGIRINSGRNGIRTLIHAAEDVHGPRRGVLDHLKHDFERDGLGDVQLARRYQPVTPGDAHGGIDKLFLQRRQIEQVRRLKAENGRKNVHQHQIAQF